MIKDILNHNCFKIIILSTFPMGCLDMLKTIFLFFFTTIRNILAYIPAKIYGGLYAEYVTKATYQMIGQRACEGIKVERVLDIGTATGNPLYSIIDKFGDAQVIGIDIDPSYVPACQKLFRNHKNVKIRQLNFYDMQTAFPQKPFDVIIFGSSFMLMPDQSKALQIAKKRLSRNGKIYFLLTLYENRNMFTNLMEIIKPYLKYLTTIDFGKLTYKDYFHKFLDEQGLKITYKDRCRNIRFFKFYIYQTQIQQ